MKRIIGRIHNIVVRLSLLQMSELIYDLVVNRGSVTMPMQRRAVSSLH
jgi:hypothetical protein